MAECDLVVGTAGHIDHGKTSLVRMLTGVDTDRLPDEKQRGITIDIGFAALDLGDVRLSLVDVPGHERFIRNMLAGATGLDLAMLVVAADDSVMPQTREHLEILRFLGLRGGLIALTKCDLVDASWLDLVEEDVRALVEGTFLEDAPVIRTSSTTGQGADALREALTSLGSSASDPTDAGLFRLAIDRAFTVAGHGTVVTGTVASGVVAVGDELALLPEGRSVRVRGLQRHDRPADRLGRGTRAAVNLAGVHHTEIRRGQELAALGYLVPTRVLSVELRPGEDAPRPVRHRARYRLHLGTAEVSASVALMTGGELAPGPASLAQLFLAEPVVAVYGQPFVLREESPPATLAGGRVLQPSPRRVRRRDSEALARVERLRSPDTAERLIAALSDRGLRPATDADLCRETGIPLGDVPETVAGLMASGLLVDLPLSPRRSVRVPVEVASALEDRVLRALARLHESRPRQSAIPRAHVASGVHGLESDAVVSGVIERLKAQGKIVGDARTVALKGYEPKLSQGERKLKAELAEAIRAGGFSPPEAADLNATAGARGGAVPELLALLRDEQRIVDINAQLYLDDDVAAEMRRRVVGRLADGSSVTMAELRDLLGTSRKYAVPLGEYLDRIGLTVRDGDSRRLGPGAAPFSGPPSAGLDDAEAAEG